jgi:AcrR family transcriptional regulator
MDGRRARKLANETRIVAAARAMIEADGVDDLSMRGLAEAAGVSVTTLYNLFDTREAIVRAARDQVIADFAPSLDSLDSVRSLAELRDTVASLLDDTLGAISGPLLLAMMNDADNSVRFFVEHRATALVLPHLQRALERGELADTLVPADLQVAIEALVSTAGRLWATGLITAGERRRRIRSGIELVLLAHATVRGRRALTGGAVRTRPVVRARRSSPASSGD